jgi:hypothetical protein
VSDGDIHFPPGQRREKPRFEPPPWERDLFDEMSKRNQEEVPAPQEPALEVVQPAEPAKVEDEPAPMTDLSARLDEVQFEKVEEDTGESEKPKLDESQVEVLLMGLRAEEPRPENIFRKVTIVAGVVSALIGLALVTWGIIAFATPGQSGSGPALLGGMLLLFGFGLIGGGAWVVYTSLRQQGVL